MTFRDRLCENMETGFTYCLRRSWDNKSPHLTAIPLRSIAAGELGRYAQDKRRRGVLSIGVKKASDGLSVRSWWCEGESSTKPPHAKSDHETVRSEPAGAGN